MPAVGAREEDEVGVVAQSCQRHITHLLWHTYSLHLEFEKLYCPHKVDIFLQSLFKKKPLSSLCGNICLPMREDMLNIPGAGLIFIQAEGL